MKSLPSGNYALCIAHPGHELRLHSFLEQARPFVFILTDGSHRTGEDMMMDSVKSISKAIKHGIQTVPGDDSWNRVFMWNFPHRPEQLHNNDKEIYLEIILRTDFFVSFINFIAKNLIKYKIDYLVADSSEGTNVCHEVMSMMADIAVKLVKKNTGKEILRYDYAIDKPFNDSVNEDCIRIQLDDEAVDRKLEAMLKFPLAITDLKPNVSLDMNVIIELSKMPDGKDQVKHLLKEINPDFFYNEYLRPVNINKVDSEKPLYEILVYEIMGEKAVLEGKYTEAITYKKHLKPLREKLQEEILNAKIVAINE